MNKQLSLGNLCLLGAISALIALSPLLVRPNQPEPSPQPFLCFLLPDPTVSTPIAPVLVAVILPADLAAHYTLSDLLAFADDAPLPLTPLLDQPLVDPPSHSLTYLFAGFVDFSNLFPDAPDAPALSVPLTAFAFFAPSDPTAPALAASDQLFVSLAPRQGATQQSSTGQKDSDQKNQAPQTEPNGQANAEPAATGKSALTQDSMTAAAPTAKSSSAQRTSVPPTPTKDPETARKLFEQDIAAFALSEAKKNPKSTAKGNGLILTVGAYPSVLPADGKSTAFIVAKVTDEEGNPLAGKEIHFSASCDTVLVERVKTDRQGLAFSHFCSEKLPQGQKKVAVIKARCNPRHRDEGGDGRKPFGDDLFQHFRFSRRLVVVTSA